VELVKLALRVDWLLGTGQDDARMLVISRDQEVFTSNIGSDSVSAIRRAGNQLDWMETVIPVGKGPEGIHISPHGTGVWTAQSRDGNVSTISVTAHKVFQTLNLNTKRSNRLKFSPDGRFVLISDLVSGRSRIFASGIGWRFQNRLLGPSGRGCHELIFNGTLPALEDKSFVTGARDKVLKSSSRARQYSPSDSVTSVGSLRSGNSGMLVLCPELCPHTFSIASSTTSSEGVDAIELCPAILARVQASQPDSPRRIRLREGFDLGWCPPSSRADHSPRPARMAISGAIAGSQSGGLWNHMPIRR
jgi:DNA-binding beta-propeller fold protein YncE